MAASWTETTVIERTTDWEYTTTPIGEQVVTEFMPLVESMMVIRHLGEAVAWLQAPDDRVGLHHLRDATIWRPEPTDPMAPTVAYMADLRTANEFHCLAGVAPTEPFEKAMRDGVVERGMSVEHVISKSEYEYLLDYPERLARWRDYIEAGVNVYRFDGTVPINFIVIDGTVYIAKSQSDHGSPYTVIQSVNPVLRSWVHEMIEKYQTDAVLLNERPFSPESMTPIDKNS